MSVELSGAMINSLHPHEQVLFDLAVDVLRENLSNTNRKRGGRGKREVPAHLIDRIVGVQAQEHLQEIAGKLCRNERISEAAAWLRAVKRHPDLTAEYSEETRKWHALACKVMDRAKRTV